MQTPVKHLNFELSKIIDLGDLFISAFPITRIGFFHCQNVGELLDIIANLDPEFGWPNLREIIIVPFVIPWTKALCISCCTNPH